MSPLASVLPVPSSVTVTTAGEPVRVTVWFGPALATGAELAAEAVMVTAPTLELSTLPSFTIKLTTKVPDTSAVKVGEADVLEDKVAELLLGLEAMLQR